MYQVSTCQQQNSPTFSAKHQVLAIQVTDALVIQETWRYSYPLHTKNTVPAWAVPVLSTCGPASVFIAWYIIWRPSRWEMHNLILGLMASVFACALITNMIKITVGVILRAAKPWLECLVAYCSWSVVFAACQALSYGRCCMQSWLQHDL